MTGEETAHNKHLVERFHQRLWGDADLSAIDELVAPDAVTHWGGSDTNTVGAVRSDVERYFAAFVDVATFIDDVIAEHDKVVLRWRTIGTHTGRYGAVTQTGRRITMEGVDTFRLTAGRIVEAWSMWDGLGVYKQMGVIDPEIG